MPARRSKPCHSTDFVYSYRVETVDGEVLRYVDIPTAMPDDSVMWRRYGGTWVEIPRPTETEYADAF